MQHINFYRHIAKKKEPLLSARQQVWGIAASCGLFFLLFALIQFQHSQLAAKAANLQKQQSVVSSTLKTLTDQKTALENDEKLLGQEALLLSEVKFRRELLANIDPDEKKAPDGFSTYLNGLARQQMSGLWFTEISLAEGGEEMALVGKAQKPEYLPRYLRKLSDEKVFNGQQFSVLRLFHEEKARGPFSFEVRTEAGETDVE